MCLWKASANRADIVTCAFLFTVKNTTSPFVNYNMYALTYVVFPSFPCLNDWLCEVALITVVGYSINNGNFNILLFPANIFFLKTETLCGIEVPPVICALPFDQM